MTPKGKTSRLFSSAAILRKQAEELLNARKDNASSVSATEADIRRLIYELEVHQIELELQNHELLEARERADLEAEKFSNLYDFAPSGYFTLSKNGRITELNLTGSRMLGQHRSHLQNRPFGFYLSADTRQIFSSFLEKVFNRHAIVSCEVTLTPQDSPPMAVTLSGICEERDEFCNVTVVDISERKFFEDTRAFLLSCGLPGTGEDFFESLARYLANSLNMEYVCIDRLEGDGLTAQTVAIFNKGRFEYNVRYDLKDTPCGAVVDKKVCCYPKDVRRLFPKDAALQELGAESYVGTTLIDSKGKAIGLIAVIGHHPLQSEQRAETLLAIVSQRASGELERREAETRLKETLEQLNDANLHLEERVKEQTRKITESEKRFSDLFHDHAAVMLLINTETGEIVDANNSAKDFYGYNFSDGSGRTLYEINALSRDEITRAIRQAASHHSSYFVFPHRLASGAIRMVEIHSSPIYTGKGTLLFSIIHDITERHIAENALVKAKSEAEKANLAKSEFLSRMSHELRTPLNSILGYSQLMEMEDLTPHLKSEVTHIFNSGKHLLALINEVLDVAGIESGKQQMSIEPLQLRALVCEVIEFVQIAADKREITIDFAGADKHNLYVLADRIRLRQVLLNLCNNSIKYNKAGGAVRIVAEVHPAGRKQTPRVRISVIDTGHGITTGDIAKLFQPFERIGADKTNTEGTGLGLMVVKKLTEAMGGTVGVESVAGVGSTFWVELLSADKPHGNTGKNDTVNAPEVRVTRKSASILYIEDNQSNVDLVEGIITNFRPGIRMITSVYGKEASKLAKLHKPCLILLDLDVPDIHGLSVLEQLLSDSQTASIPVIIVSADAIPQHTEKLMKAGAVGYLTKPLDVIQFLKTIDQYIKK